jgi:ribosome-associated toxin RatA of RatAB toxin-antitoxin module
MTTVVERSVLVEFSAARMRALVEDIEAYPQFLPWCAGAVIGSRVSGRVVATLTIAYRGIRQQFTTENIAEKHGAADAIDIRLVSGPFKSLDGLWIFQPLEEDACKVKLELRYEFANRLLESLVGPVFRYIADTMVEAFVQRARALYGTPD